MKMKKIIIIIACGALLILSGVLFAQNQSRRTAEQQRTAAEQRPAGPVASFDRAEHNFGTIREEMGIVATQFELTNSGTTPLIIQRVSIGCGCAPLRYPREPILPGQTARITMEYHTTGRPGAFNRSATIFTNVPDTVFTLRVRGTVTPREQ